MFPFFLSFFSLSRFVFLRFHSQTAIPKDAVPYSINQTAVLCKENRSRNPFRRFVGFFSPFVSDVWRSFSQGGRACSFSGIWWCFLVEFDWEAAGQGQKKCRIRLHLRRFNAINCHLSPILTSFLAFLSGRAVLARLFLFVYNENRIQTHLFLQCEHKAGGTALKMDGAVSVQEYIDVRRS